MDVEHKLHDCHLINTAKYMMKIDCKDVSFPMEIPDDCQLCDSDRLILNKVLAERYRWNQILSPNRTSSQMSKTSS
jgi:hypothetical protein